MSSKLLPRAGGTGPMTIDAAVWNRLCDALEGASHVIVNGGTVHNGPSGTAIGVSAPPETWFLGLVVTAGPNGESDFTDERYWVQTAFIANDGTQIISDSADVEPAPSGAPAYAIVPVTNLPESGSGSHSLPAGSPVLFRLWFDQTNQARFIMNCGGGSVAAGQYQYQVYSMLSDNQTGWDWIRAH